MYKNNVQNNKSTKNTTASSIIKGATIDSVISKINLNVVNGYERVWK